MAGVLFEQTHDEVGVGHVGAVEISSAHSERAVVVTGPVSFEDLGQLFLDFFEHGLLVFCAATLGGRCVTRRSSIREGMWSW